MVVKNVELPEYSVLMSVYAGEKPEHLRASIESMLSQTYVTNDFVLVCDGKLTKELDEVVDYFEENYECFHPIRLKENVGTGRCANRGIDACKNEYIVKMDSDDIAKPDRCERSLYAMAKHPEIDMLGAYIDEFDSQTGEVIATKKTPLTNKEIHKYARRRNPFNNQTLVYKKSRALSVGGYSNIKRCEDYEFVVNNYERRRNWANTKSFVNVRWKIFRMGYSNLWDFIVPCTFQFFIFIMPKSLTGKIYKRFLRG